MRHIPLIHDGKTKVIHSPTDCKVCKGNCVVIPEILGKYNKIVMTDNCYEVY